MCRFVFIPVYSRHSGTMPATRRPTVQDPIHIKAPAHKEVASDNIESAQVAALVLLPKEEAYTFDVAADGSLAITLVMNLAAYVLGRKGWGHILCRAHWLGLTADLYIAGYLGFWVRHLDSPGCNPY